MRYQPAFVDRIAGKSAAKVVVYPALTDVLERQGYGVEIARLAGALARPPEEFEQHRLWKFGRAASAAVDWIEQAAELLSGAIELRGADHHPALWARALGEPLHQGAAIVLDVDNGICRRARVVLGGVAPVPWRVPAVEQLLLGKAVTSELAEEAGRAAVAGARPLAKNGYKVPMTQAMVARTIAALAQVRSA